MPSLRRLPKTATPMIAGRFATSLLCAELVNTQSGLWPAAHPITPPLFRFGPPTTCHARVPRHPIGTLASDSAPPPRPHSTGRLPIRCRIPAGRDAGQREGRCARAWAQLPRCVSPDQSRPSAQLASVSATDACSEPSRHVLGVSDRGDDGGSEQPVPPVHWPQIERAEARVRSPRFG